MSRSNEHDGTELADWCAVIFAFLSGGGLARDCVADQYPHYTFIVSHIAICGIGSWGVYGKICAPHDAIILGLARLSKARLSCYDAATG